MFIISLLKSSMDQRFAACGADRALWYLLRFINVTRGPQVKYGYAGISTVTDRGYPVWQAEASNFQPLSSFIH